MLPNLLPNGNSSHFNSNLIKWPNESHIEMQSPLAMCSFLKLALAIVAPMQTPTLDSIVGKSIIYFINPSKGWLDDTQECHSYVLMAGSGSNTGLSQNMRLHYWISYFVYQS